MDQSISPGSWQMGRCLSALLACALSLGGAPARAAAPDNLPSAMSELANANIRRAIVASAHQLTPEGRAAAGRAILACQLPDDAADQVTTGKFDRFGFDAECSQAYDEAQRLCVDGGCGEFLSYVTLERKAAGTMTDPAIQYMLNNADQATVGKLRDSLAKQRSYADGLKKVLEDSAQ
jgi:hypothetical protein